MAWRISVVPIPISSMAAETWATLAWTLSKTVPLTFTLWSVFSIAAVNALRLLPMVPALWLLNSASFRISLAITENPRPASPAWATSMAAFMASRLVSATIPEALIEVDDPFFDRVYIALNFYSRHDGFFGSGGKVIALVELQGDLRHEFTAPFSGRCRNLKLFREIKRDQSKDCLNSESPGATYKGHGNRNHQIQGRAIS